jgi:GTP-binding protein
MLLAAAASCGATMLGRPVVACSGLPHHLLRLAAARMSVASWQSAADRDGIEFVGGFKSPQDMPDFGKLPEFCLAGRSNVGKSSALNTLSGRRKKVAVVSKTPGRTRLINLFRVGKTCSVVDLPGYGFAKVSVQMQETWRSQITAYLRRRSSLKLAVLFVDAQREPQEQDAQLLDFLEQTDLPTLVVATKADKLKKAELERSLSRLRESLALPDGQPLPLSSTTGEGKREVWRASKQLRRRYALLAASAQTCCGLLAPCAYHLLPCARLSHRRPQSRIFAHSNYPHRTDAS